jgi:hypothetical protein
MRFPRYLCLVGFLAGAALVLGCSDNSKGMKNMQPGSGPPVQKELQLKKGKKPLPADPPDPKAPP